MARLVPAVVTALALLVGPSAASAHAAATAKQELKSARTFAFALGVDLTSANLTRLARRDLVILDGEDAGSAKVKRLQRGGALVLGYLSVGSVESWRSWFSLLEDHRLEPLGDWDGERYADTADPALRDALADTIAPSLLEKGFDGLFLDNVDMVEDHPLQADGMVDLVKRISTRVRAGGGVLMAQNGDSIIAPYLALLDGWNREDPTGTYDFERKKYVPTDAGGRAQARATLRAVKAAGVVTTTTDYFGSPNSPAALRAVRIACSVGAIPFVGDIALRRVAKQPTRCPGK
ncbi:MAG: endo alpha-1,4 polygalactosaminidase [Solirubrobacteraceae bacterium]|nr:endo alpha-1,4 polygalactosaminidase [Solirubrobacteraceae bacterium]